MTTKILVKPDIRREPTQEEIEKMAIIRSASSLAAAAASIGVSHPIVYGIMQGKKAKESHIKNLLKYAELCK
jgi:hypothetical protein